MPTNQELLQSLRDVSSCAYPYAMGRYGRKWQPVYPDSSPFFLFSCLYESQLANAEAIIGPFWYIKFGNDVWVCCNNKCLLAASFGANRDMLRYESR